MFMDTVSFVFDNSIVVGIIVFLLIYLLSRWDIYIFKISEDKQERNVSDFVTCSAPDCVRCNKYKSTIRHAEERLANLTDDELTLKIRSALLEPVHHATESYLEQNPSLLFYDQLHPRWFWDVCDFGDVSKLESSHSIILKDFISIRENPDLLGWKKNRTPTGSWDVFPLINQGCVVEDNISRCPGTMDVINSLSSVMTNNVFGNVMFSVVKPSTVITEHYGPTNIRLRCHLGLVTTDECTLTVADEQTTWSDGKCLIFDDSFLHSVTHSGVALETDSNDTVEYEQQANPETSQTSQSDEMAKGISELPSSLAESISTKNTTLATGTKSMNRAVLIVDLWHPDISRKERDAIDFVFCP